MEYFYIREKIVAGSGVEQEVNYDLLVDVIDEQGNPVVKCLLCGKCGNRRNNMRQHMRLNHAKPTNDICNYCHKVFKHKYYLHRHIRSRECLS